MKGPREGAVLAGLIAAIVAVGWLDRMSQGGAGFLLLYMIPIVSAGWLAGPLAAVACALAACGIGFFADSQARSSVGAVAAWSVFTRLAIFLAMGLLTARVRSDQRRLTDLLDREKRLARTDAMTGLMNHRGFVEALMREASRCRRAIQPLCVAYLDLDNFKQVNDRYGHAAGDAVLVRIAHTIQETVRAGDIPARLGGDEFVILFWEVNRDAVEGIAQRLIERVSEAGVEYPLAGLGASVGIAYFAAPPESVEEILKRADNAMYEAKTMGKGVLAVWSSDPAPSSA